MLAISADEPLLIRSEPQGFVSIHPAVLPFLESTSCDLFDRPDDSPPRLLHSRMRSIDADAIARLASRQLDRILVRVESLESIAKTLAGRLDKILASATTPATHKFHLVQLSATASLAPYASRRYVDEFIEATQQLGVQIAALLYESDVTPLDLFRVSLQFPVQTTQLTRIAGYTVLLAEAMGVDNREEIGQVAQGAMLHKLGMFLLPPLQHTADGTMTPEDRELRRKYPQLGYERICDRDELTFAQLMMVYQHREHRDGSGFPVAIETDEIHPWAGALAVAAAFDARASAGPPSRRYESLTSALAYLADHAYCYFDPKAVLWWISSFQQT